MPATNTVERNYFTLGSDYSPYNSNYQVSVNGNVNHIYIIQNYINGVVYSYNGAASFVYILNNYIGVAMKFQGDDTNMYVINNVFFGSGYISTVSSAICSKTILSGDIPLSMRPPASFRTTFVRASNFPQQTATRSM